jgi:hemoglobin
VTGSAPTSLLDGVHDEALTQAVAGFYDRMLADERVAHRFRNVNLPKLKAHQRSFLVAALGSPGTYNALTLQHAHFALGISSAEFDIAVAHLRDSLLDAGIPESTSAAIAARLSTLHQHIVAPATR